MFKFEQFGLYLCTTRPNMKRIHAIRLAFLANLLCDRSSKTCNSLSLDSTYRKRNENFVERCVQEHAEYYIQYTMNQSGFVKNCQYLERNSNRIRQKILHEVLSIKIKLAYNDIKIILT